jgi:hypothetical protein
MLRWQKRRDMSRPASPSVASTARNVYWDGSTVCRGLRTRQRSRMGSLVPAGEGPMYGPCPHAALSAFVGAAVFPYASPCTT